MPSYDYSCPTCKVEVERITTISARNEQDCNTCHGRLERIFRPNNVIGDDIPGGVEIRHGLCNEDGSPRRYYSKSEMAREAQRRGLVNLVRHIPERGSDKSKHTTRWV